MGRIWPFLKEGYPPTDRFFNGQGSKFGRPDLKDPDSSEPEILWTGRSDPVIYLLQVSAPYLET